MDEFLRDIERRASSGDILAQVQLLQARLRSGSTSFARLRLAAALGCPAAIELVDNTIEDGNADLPIFPLPSVGLHVFAGRILPAHITLKEGLKTFFQVDNLKEPRLSEIAVPLPANTYECSINFLTPEELHLLMRQSSHLMRSWINQQPVDKQSLYWDVPNYMIDRIASLESRLDLIVRVSKSAFPDALLRHLIEWWLYCEQGVRLLAYEHLGINQIPALTDEIYNRWALEFFRALVPWLIGNTNG